MGEDVNTAMHRFDEEFVADITHAATLAFQGRVGDPCPGQPWFAETDEQRQSVIDGVRKARMGTTAEKSHENWVRFKLEHGWTLGEKDPQRKTHPNLVPYAELPYDEKVKDQLFLAIVTALTVDPP
jgi:hypothetical protein